MFCRRVNTLGTIVEELAEGLILSVSATSRIETTEKGGADETCRQNQSYFNPDAICGIPGLWGSRRSELSAIRRRTAANPVNVD